VTRLLLKIISEGKLTADEVYAGLKKYETVGIGRDIVFNDDRVNNSVSILVFKDNLIRRISQWTVAQ